MLLVLIPYSFDGADRFCTIISLHSLLKDCQVLAAVIEEHLKFNLISECIPAWLYVTFQNYFGVFFLLHPIYVASANLIILSSTYLSNMEISLEHCFLVIHCTEDNITNSTSTDPVIFDKYELILF